MNTMATGYSGPGRMVAHNMVTTQFELDGFRVVRTLGVVRGIVVRSRSIFGTIGASLQTILGGNITLLTNLCEKTRAEAFDLMLQHSAELGGNAVVGARYDATEVMQGVTEVLAYGTAVVVEPSRTTTGRRDGRALPLSEIEGMSRPSAARCLTMRRISMSKSSRAPAGPDGSKTRPHTVCGYPSNFLVPGDIQMFPATGG
jgi:uncharacterized protein YbjQ (UPF0145 family)